MGFTLRAIRENDLENIMRWRMDEDITRYMNTNPKLTLEGQKKWLEAISENSDVFYRLIEVDGVPVGVINLTKLNAEDGNIGWAYYVGEKKQRSMKLALALEMNMYDYVFDTLGKNAVYSDVFTLNKGVIALHKLCGCEVVEEKKAHVCKEGVYYDVTFMRMTADNWKRIKQEKKYEKITFI
jgi:UDP-4-amino-4,6-dideoxy-N-acetyl-beta-L-altrosamine N-acetyltransferase